MSAAVKATFDQPPAPLPRRKFVPVEAFKPRAAVCGRKDTGDAGRQRERRSGKSPVTDRVPGIRHRIGGPSENDGVAVICNSTGSDGRRET